MKRISVVVPVYCEQDSLQALYDALTAVAATLPEYEWEFVFVNDGSTDDSDVRLRALCSVDARCKLVDLSRNFGKEVALTAGVQHSSGDAAICIDADLQHPPARIPDMVAAWEQGAEIVEMVRARDEAMPWLRKLGSRAFYWMLRRLSSLQMSTSTTDFRLLDRKVINALLRIDERDRMFRGLIDWLGFRKVRMEFVAPGRSGGTSGFSYARLVQLALQTFVGNSELPLQLIGLLGIVITLLGGCLLAFMVLAQLITPASFAFTPLAIFVVFNTLLSGIVLTAMGILSLYMGKVYRETQRRPLFVVRETVNLDSDSGSSPP